MPSGVYKHKLLSEKTKQKMSKIRKGKKRLSFSEKWKKNLSLANKGKKKPLRTLEHRKHLSMALTGKKLSLETRKKLSEKHKGKNIGIKHWNWKGGKTPINLSERIRFRRTIQKQVFERDGYTYQICGIKGGNITVDHIQNWKEYIELRFCINNCRTLCQQCHYKITFGKPMPPIVRAWGHNLKEVISYKT